MSFIPPTPALPPAPVVCLVSHAGPAGQFATLFETLPDDTYQIFASGPALDVLRRRHTKNVTPFELASDEEAERLAASELAGRLNELAINAILTDIGSPFTLKVHEALKPLEPRTRLLAYYDNGESFVPGGYSETVGRIIETNDKIVVIFSNKHHKTAPIYSAPAKEILLPAERRIALGYSSAPEMGDKYRRAREEALKNPELRKSFFEQYEAKECDHLWVYLGGNNETYFLEALPAFFTLLKEAMAAGLDLSKHLIVIQRHPGVFVGEGVGARREEEALRSLWEEIPSSRAPQIRFSPKGKVSDEVIPLADRLFYFQTSTAAALGLSGAPIAQIGKETYPDVLVGQGFPSITKAEELFSLGEPTPLSLEQRSRIMEAIGFDPAWRERFRESVGMGVVEPLFDEAKNASPLLLEILRTVGCPEEALASPESLSAWTQSNLTRKGERWEAQSPRFEALKEELLPLFRRAGMVDERRAQESRYCGALLHGATLPAVRHRLQALIQEWNRGVRFDALYFLGGTRPLMTDPLPGEEFAREGKEKLLAGEKRAGGAPPTDEEAWPKTEIEMMQWVWEHDGVPEEMRRFIRPHFICAPSEKATTEETLRAFVATDPAKGKYLAISNNPYVLRQGKVAEGYEGLAIETVGPAASPAQKMAIYLDEIAKLIAYLQ